MTPEEIVAELRRVLASERAAIRQIDGAGVAAAAEKKEGLGRALAAVQRDTIADRAAFAASLKDLRRELLHNSMLLANAKAALAKVIELAKGRLETTA